MENIFLAIVLAPLFGAIAAGLFGRKLGRVGGHTITIAGVALSCGLSLHVLWGFIKGTIEPYNGTVYQWMTSGGFSFEVGFMVDALTATMMGVVTFVSLMVHIYTIGYMDHDEENWPEDSKVRQHSYQRFFSYISLFTFSMLMLVMSNNFLQLFFGWEAVGLVSYLLIGFWSTRETAIFANLKAFLVNRVGDFGFLLGIAAVLYYFGSLDYVEVFASAQTPEAAARKMSIFGQAEWSVITVICILLFIGAMGKSAQAPLHVWLPDSMEGPTPISALIHAATMVTAGIFMVARMSPLFEMSEAALSFVLVIGATTAFFMGLIGVVQNDIKRVVAYSTLSQLGYMTAALGASAYSAAIFHLMTHAFFKALLFLAAGSVIIAMHHKQDMREMGGLRKYMPITFICSVLGTLALIGFPGFSGFYSKDAIVMAVHDATRPGAGYAYWMLFIGVFVTAMYSFRLLYLAFFGQPRMDEQTKSHLHESPWVVTLPLVLLAIPSVGIAWFATEPMLFGSFFGDAIFNREGTDPMAHMREVWEQGETAAAFAIHGFVTAPVWLAIGGTLLATVMYLLAPRIGDRFERSKNPLRTVLEKKYWFDELYQNIFAAGGRLLGKTFWKAGDQAVIDGAIVNGSARTVGFLAGVIRRLQSGLLYHYAFAMIVGLIALLGAYVIF